MKGKRLPFVLIGSEEDNFKCKKKKLRGERRSLVRTKWNFMPTNFRLERNRKCVMGLL